MFHVLGALAEFERSLIVERTTAGLASPRARGKILGHPRKLSSQEIDAAAVDTAQSTRSPPDVARSLSVSTSTLRRALQERTPNTTRRVAKSSKIRRDSEGF
jgi:DNA invertase Pin-like site-specific DNA recombinase